MEDTPGPVSLVDNDLVGGRCLALAWGQGRAALLQGGLCEEALGSAVRKHLGLDTRATEPW